MNYIVGEFRCFKTPFKQLELGNAVSRYNAIKNVWMDIISEKETDKRNKGKQITIMLLVFVMF